MDRYELGYDELDDGADFKTFGINVKRENDEIHYNQIRIYGDEKLRDKILNFLKLEENVVG